MKYLVLLCDGASDYPVKEIGGKTPLAVAKKPMMNKLAKMSYSGIVSNVPEGMVPESDTANLAVLSYDPRVFSKGRSPLEAVSMGIDMSPDETAYRCNLVTLGDPSGVEVPYERKVMIDHGADEITTPEADELIKALQEDMGNALKKFYTGVSYRHCLIWKDAPSFTEFMRPHDILGEDISQYLPGEPFLSIQKRSYEILKNHPVNLERIKRGLNPANSAWFWSPGKKPALPDFNKKWGVKGSVISAVDLIKGIGICAGLHSVDVEGTTGAYDTNYRGKGQAAIDEFSRNQDYVYVHVEAPDECGHRAELQNKISSIEKIDGEVLEPIYNYLAGSGEDFKILILPDHPTPVSKRTHTMDPVPFILYHHSNHVNGIDCFDEENALKTGIYLPKGELLTELMINGER